MQISGEMIVAKIKQETLKLEKAVSNQEKTETIREHTRLVRAYSELLEEGTSSVKPTENPKTFTPSLQEESSLDRSASIHQPHGERTASTHGNLLEF
ncbi:hypothetical protein HNR44_002539 [Geomicrobium halophilum]|uniref:Uncharacterized protein n=1 Tax=Geomicrobium halophilum TaxID=549000 RepID=A0A841PTR7_9BACL|nr:DUF5327 family protein [Geomicrobium halophilum]MBB6450556.1 hypothetical protein [Geomicrobium halophilum]